MEIKEFVSPYNQGLNEVIDFTSPLLYPKGTSKRTIGRYSSNKDSNIFLKMNNGSVKDNLSSQKQQATFTYPVAVPNSLQVHNLTGYQEPPHTMNTLESNSVFDMSNTNCTNEKGSNYTGNHRNSHRRNF